MPGMPVFQDSPESLKNQIFGSSGNSAVAIRTDSTGHLYIATDTGDTVNITANNLDIRDLANASDNIQIYGTDGTTNTAIKTDASGNLSVTATNLDIRDIANVSDSIQIFGNDGTSNTAIKTDASGNLSVTATNLDIRDIANASDNIQIFGNDGTSNVAIKTNSEGNLLVSTTSTFTEDNIGVLTTTDSYQGTTAEDISVQESYSFFIKNTGSNSATLKIQLSPNNTDWVDDGSEVTLDSTVGSNMTILSANKFLKYIRVAYKSTVASNSTTLTAIYQSQS